MSKTKKEKEKGRDGAEQTSADTLYHWQRGFAIS